MEFIDVLKTASFVSRAPVYHDSLEEDKLPKWRSKGTTLGTTVGGIGGGLVGLALPAVAGYMATHPIGDGGSYLLSGSSDAHPYISGALGVIGGSLAAPQGLIYAPIGAGLGAYYGGRLGGFIGNQINKKHTNSENDLNTIAERNPAQSRAYLATIKAHDLLPENRLKPMVDAYNARHENARDFVRAAYAV
jgi:hypothetical protein